MTWFYALLLAIVFFLGLCATKSVALGFVCGLLAFVFFLWSAAAFFASRYDSGSRDSGQLLSPEDLRAFREQAEARKAALEAQKAAAAPTPSTQGPAPQEPLPPAPDPPSPPPST